MNEENKIKKSKSISVLKLIRSCIYLSDKVFIQYPCVRAALIKEKFSLQRCQPHQPQPYSMKKIFSV